MAVNKILNTSNALYGNIVRALSGDTILPKMEDLLGFTPTAAQYNNYAENLPVTGVTWTAIQGIARTSTNWFAIDTTELRKYDLTGTLLATNATPFSSLPVGVNHCGDSFASGLYLYVPISNWDGSTQTSTSQVIAKYLLSDLSYDSHFDVSTQSEWNCSGLCLSPDGLQILGTSYNNSLNTPDNRNVDIYAWNLSTGAYEDTYQLDTSSMGTQGITWTGEYYYLTSWDTPKSRINIYSKGFKFVTQFDPSITGEIEGIECYGGKIYFHKISTLLRELYTANMKIGLDDSDYSAVKFLGGPAIGDSGTILIKLRPNSVYNFNALINNDNYATDWEGWVYSDGRLSFRVDTATPSAITPVGSIVASNRYIIAFTWNNVAGTVEVKAGIDGVYQATSSGGTWVTPPAAGLTLGGKENDPSKRGDAVFDDVVVFNKVLSDAELLDTYNNFDTLYSPIPTSTLSITATGTPDGTYKTIITNPVDDSIIFEGDLVYTSGAASTGLLSVAVGTDLTGYVIDNEATHIDGAVITGTTV